MMIERFVIESVLGGFWDDYRKSFRGIVFASEYETKQQALTAAEKVPKDYHFKVETDTGMYDFSKVTPTVLLTPDWILSRISDAQIFFHYHGRFKLGTACKSSLKKDTHPSVMFFVGKSGRINYWDFRDQKGLDCFGYVQALCNCSFKRALEIIAEDFGLIDKKTCRVSAKLMSAANDIDRSVKRDTLIQFIPGKWEKGMYKNLRFWELFEITQEELEREGVFPVQKLFLNKQEITTTEDILRFAKVVKYQDEGVEKVGVKIYSPFDSNMKWLSSIPLACPFGLDNLKYDSNVVFITKSFKDMIVLRKIFTSVIATQNESEAALPEEVIKHLDDNFDQKIVVFDNDETGVASCKKFNNRGFGYFNIPNMERIKYGIKDPSDYVKTYGLDDLRELFMEKHLL